MALNEIIKIEEGNLLSFGDHELKAKEKTDNYEVNGDVYKIKTYSQMTKLERNGRLLYESVPGTTVTGFVLKDTDLEFNVDGFEDAQVTIELESEKDYKVFINEILLGKIKSNLAGKITFGADFENGAQKVSIMQV